MSNKICYGETICLKKNEMFFLNKQKRKIRPGNIHKNKFRFRYLTLDT